MTTRFSSSEREGFTGAVAVAAVVSLRTAPAAVDGPEAVIELQPLCRESNDPVDGACEDLPLRQGRVIFTALGEHMRGGRHA